MSPSMTPQSPALDAEFRLGDDFPPVGFEAWRTLAEADLNGAVFEQKLVTHTYEGIDVQPVYTKADWPAEGDPYGFPGLSPFVRGSRPLGAVLKVDYTAVREAQIAGLNKLRSEREPAKVDATLNALIRAARTQSGNLLELTVEAARARATVGEISEALERVYGRYEAPVRVVRGVYAAEAGGGQMMIQQVRRMVGQFERAEGRRPRILLAKMGQDGHDRGQKVLATALADLGFDVDVGPLFQSPAETARQAVENDVHIVGVSTLAAGHLTLVPQLRKELADLGREDIMIVVGGVIPPHDYPALYEAGASAVFGPGTVVGEAAAKLLQVLADRLDIPLQDAVPATTAGS